MSADRLSVCPTCGSPVHVVSADEGTSHYEPEARTTVEREALSRLMAERDRYRNALDVILAEAREADDGWTITTCEEAIQGA